MGPGQKEAHSQSDQEDRVWGPFGKDPMPRIPTPGLLNLLFPLPSLCRAGSLLPCWPQLLRELRPLVGPSGRAPTFLLLSEGCLAHLCFPDSCLSPPNRSQPPGAQDPCNLAHH